MVAELGSVDVQVESAEDRALHDAVGSARRTEHTSLQYGIQEKPKLGKIYTWNMKWALHSEVHIPCWSEYSMLQGFFLGPAQIYARRLYNNYMRKRKRWARQEKHFVFEQRRLLRKGSHPRRPTCTKHHGDTEPHTKGSHEQSRIPCRAYKVARV